MKSLNAKADAVEEVMMLLRRKECMFSERLEKDATRCSVRWSIDRKDICYGRVVVRLRDTCEDIPAISWINDFGGGINDKVRIKS